MGEFFVYSFFFGTLLFLFPIFVDADLYLDAYENRGWFSISLYHRLRLFGGYAEVRGESCAVAEIPLYYECGWHNGAFSPQPVAVAIHCPQASRFARLTRNRGWNDEKNALIESWQWPAERKEAAADLVLDNSGDLAMLARSVDRLLEQLAERRAAADAALTQAVAALCACDDETRAL